MYLYKRKADVYIVIIVPSSVKSVDCKGAMCIISDRVTLSNSALYKYQEKVIYLVYIS